MTDEQKEQARQDILRDIDAATEPAKMSLLEALVFLEELEGYLEARIEALKSDMGEDVDEEDGDENGEVEEDSAEI